MNIRTHALASTAVAVLAIAGLTLPSLAATTPPSGGSGGSSPGVVSGTITAVDTTAGTITVTPASGTASTITYSTKTNIIDHKTILLSDIAVGDTLAVSGVLASVNASSIVKTPAVTAPTTTTGSGSSSGSGSGASCPTPVAGAIQLTGVVATLSPLTLTVGSSLTLILNTADTTTFAQVGPGTSADLATGEAVTVLVSKSKTGTLTATEIDVTLAA